MPVGIDDCEDAASYLLSEEAESRLGSSLRVISGESAGAYLAVQPTLRLRDQGIDVRRKLVGLAPFYGCFDLSKLPSLRQDEYGADAYYELAFPSEMLTSLELSKQSQWSPLYADLKDIPPEIFEVGTEDMLVEDTILMGARWELAGNEAELCMNPGSPHGYLVLGNLEVNVEAVRDMVRFVNEQL